MQLHRDIATIRATGGEVYVIGNGAPNFIAGFRETTGWDGPLYTDPTLEVYKAAQLKRGVVATLNARSIMPSLRALSHGSRQGAKQGDQWQQGGVLVIAPSGEVKWHHASERPGDDPTAAQILAAL